MRKKIKNSGKHMGLIIGILLIATSLRAPFTSVAPLLESIRDDFSLSAARAGVLQTLPLLAFALFSPLAAGFGRRLGIERTLFVALLIVVAGIMIRSCAGLAGLFGGTLLIGLGIALGNVLLPGLLKRDLPHRAASLTGLYALTMGLAAALASAVMIPFTTFFHTGWSPALLMTLALPMVALIVWLPRLKRDPVAATHDAAHPHAPARVWRSALAWQVSLFFGLNSVIYYIIVSWLPAMLQNLGFTAAQAGSLHGVLQLASALPGFFIGSILARLRDQRVLGVAIALTGAVGLTGLLMIPVMATLWVVLIGISTGAGIILGLAFISLRAGNAVQAAALSGMAQCVGYLLAAGGPPLAGLLHDRMDGWAVPLTVCTLL
ncbi:MFS transporter, partial [Erwinia oleae]|uniref:MFS transporter n=1 Tax=Erwinia oleae TaxID=796334 RepID=UPI000558BF03